MSVVNATPLLLGGEGYQISRSVRLRSSASATFSRTPASASNRRTWSWSAWVKRGSLAGNLGLFSAKQTKDDITGFYINSSDKLVFLDRPSNSTNALLITTMVFRDPSAWYHIMVVVDSTQATNTNRIKFFVNGVQATQYDSATYPSQNYEYAYINNTTDHRIGAFQDNTAQNFDGYLTEINFIDGQALTPSSFGETDAVTGVWKPKKYAGTYGTNGFYLNFSDNSAATAAAIGKDWSGNGNNWTPNNISVTAGVTYDSMLDVPTIWADGGNGRGNYAVLNPLSTLAAGATVSGANLNIVGASASAYGSPATMLLTSGKWYFEVTAGSVASRYPVVGVQTELTAFLSSGFPGGYTANGFGYGSDGNKFVNNGAATAFGSTFTSGDVIGVAIDIDAGKVWLAKNNTWQASGDPAAGTNAAYSPTAGTPLYPCVGTYNGAGTHSANFGQRPFAYTPPTGFKALNTQNLPDATIKKGNQYFDATTYTGTGSSQSIVNSGRFQPDFVWTKSRSSATDPWHRLVNSVVGPTYSLFSNTTNAEIVDNALSSFNSNGFTVQGTNSSNQSGQTYVGWQWKESASAGFDIVTYTGTLSSAGTQTFAHSLGVKPAMIITKKRSSTSAWVVLHQSLANWNTAAFLNLTNAASSISANGSMADPTSSVFSTNWTDGMNISGQTYVAYLFSEVAGFSKFGSYTGNGSADGPFVYCGFRPRYLMVKRTDTAGYNWIVWDSARDTYNQEIAELYPSLPDAEGNSSTNGRPLDFLSNGFKWRGTNAIANASGGTYIFAAFAENPFKNSLAR